MSLPTPKYILGFGVNQATEVSVEESTLSLTHVVGICRDVAAKGPYSTALFAMLNVCVVQLNR